MVAAWIRARRESLKLTHAALATRIGVSPVQVVRWEMKKEVPSPQNLKRLESVLGPVDPKKSAASAAGARARVQGRPESGMRNASALDSEGIPVGYARAPVK